MVWCGIGLLVLAVIFFFISRSSKGDLDAMNAADTFTAQLLNEHHGQVVPLLGAEALAQVCEIEGVIECDQPLRAPVSGQQCVAYTYSIERQYEERVKTKDSNGREETRVDRKSQSEHSEDKRTRFWVRDSTGRVLVEPDKADLDLVAGQERFDAEEGRWSGSTRTLGRKHSEQLLPIGTQVYVLGCAVDRQGQVVIAAHPKDGKFMIKRGTERQLANAAASSSKNFMYAAMGSGAVGVLLMILDMVF